MCRGPLALSVYEVPTPTSAPSPEDDLPDEGSSVILSDDDDEIIGE
ncbi:3378_t:CDS:2 [Ambispora gerdemannii]|uniref:3378_t:CDS:1 n=1 Tax=Ambispora gerdemannii TaxID=144530 RepID=A0A9N8ZJ97_9GLOM|nr:3378_t:CDS:2 [Ambispora gerdemannii]